MKNRSAFTLIELLVVVAVITILIAVLMPALASARQQALSAGCKSNLRQIMFGYILYSHEYDGRIIAVLPEGTTSQAELIIQGRLRNGEYVKNERAWICGQHMQPWNLDWTNVPAAWRQWKYSYTYNGQLSRLEYKDVETVGGPLPPYKMSQFPNPGRLLGFVDGNSYMFRYVTDNIAPYPPGEVLINNEILIRRVSWRHRNLSNNAGFLDAHVEEMNSRMNWKLWWDVTVPFAQK